LKWRAALLLILLVASATMIAEPIGTVLAASDAGLTKDPTFGIGNPIGPQPLNGDPIPGPPYPPGDND